ncbi:MAG: hypothetical protein AAFX93_01255 [Verrucomicrobiota bacterium]
MIRQTGAAVGGVLSLMILGMCLIAVPANADDSPIFKASDGFQIGTQNEFSSASAQLPAGVVNPKLPGYVILEANGSDQLIPLEVDLLASITYDPSAPFNVSLFQFVSNMGAPTVNGGFPETSPLTVNSHGPLVVSNILAPDDTDFIGNAAILALGQPNPDAVAGIGSDVNVSIFDDITVSGVGSETPGEDAIKLEPAGLRTAQLSAVTAVSFGLQGDHGSSRTGSTVNVDISGGSLITVNQTDSSVLTAGISASSAAGQADQGFFNDPSKVHKVTVTHSGAIAGNADSSVGIFANTTGAQFPDENSQDIAIGGAVDVILKQKSSIELNGVGVFALSEVSPVSDTSDIAIEGGSVIAIVEKDSVISVGNQQGGSALSFGVLAVSAAGNQLIDPFSSTQEPIDTKGDGKGGEVAVRNAGEISTYGDTSVGIAALSIGGASVVTTTGSGQAQQNSYLGSNGDFKGGGKQVIIENAEDGAITTIGSAAHGIVGLSSASGGLLNNLQEANRSDQDNPIGLSIGNGPTGSTGIGHDGGGVSITNAGIIVTGDGTGDSKASVGILAQSIGGGGGSAGNKSSLFVGDHGGAGGNGGAIDIVTTSGSSLTTKDANSIGILAQSIGGGGGNGGNSEGFFVDVGGGGGNGGKGGTISFLIDGEISTNDVYSSGLIAQSVGGGGGHGGGATAYTVALPTGVGVGGKGGKGGAGGKIGDNLNLSESATIGENATITTIGDSSPGAIIQSIGGGGGTGGGASSIDATVSISIAVAVGGAGGDGGPGGDIYLTNRGEITTGQSVTTPRFGLTANEGADSIGAIVQSIGGGGGHGGSASALSLAVVDPLDDDPTAFSVAVATGGSGGSGGDGGESEFYNSGSIVTWGDGAHGALVQSIGGGGGNGGDSNALSSALASDAPSVTLSVSHGGSGGSSGDGGFASVSLEATSSIETNGLNASGLVVQSIGGGGGNGGTGSASSKNIDVGGDDDDDPTQASLNMVIGGSGGAAGTGGDAFVENEGSIVTDGIGSRGIHAMSVGGGGGNSGGGSVGGGAVTYNIDFVIGASGGNGGNGSLATVSNSSSIVTMQGDSTAILAQSIGGGGGAGGNAVIQEGTIPANSYTSSISVGGQGKGGGDGDTVRVNNLGSLTTNGARSHGVVAQSIGGGGGVGGAGSAYSSSSHGSTESGSVNVAVGGNGGNGGDGGEVTVIAGVSPIATEGYASHGVLAQSVGGGGGIGGDATLDISSTLSLGFVAVSDSDSAGSGGSVKVDQNDHVSTMGHQSVGILAQSVGGGGGVVTQGSHVRPLSIDVTSTPSIGMTFGINTDSDGGDPSNGGSTIINLNHAAMLSLDQSTKKTTSTQGDWSIGLLAQSIGAGGGKGDTISGTHSRAIPKLTVVLGSPEGHGEGGAVEINAGTAKVSTGSDTGGFGAYGVLAQSIGGGGGIATDGSSAASGTMTLGGQSSDSTRDGGTVALSADALSVETKGTAAHGIILQSIGGGGGVAGTGATEDYSGSLDDVTGPSLTLGGQDTFGNGNEVSMERGHIEVKTSGDNAFGLVAQSIGGGGGIATSKQTDGEVSLGLTINDSNQDTRDGGIIDLTLAGTPTNRSSITTTGTGSHGLVAQSIGGGGGIANPDGSSAITVNTTTQSDAARGYGDDVTLHLNGDIETHGKGANGVVAQIIGGGGGLFNQFAGSTGGDNSSEEGYKSGELTINVGLGARIRTHGSATTAIFAQSVVGNGKSGNAIMINVDGLVSSEQGDGIMVSGGRGSNSDDITNTVTINFSGEVTSPYDKQAVGLAGFDSTEIYMISNHGRLSGSISIENADSDSMFTNEVRGTFHSGDYVQAVMQDYGLFSIAGEDIGQTEMLQNYTQNSNEEAILKFDVESQESFDSLVFNASFGTFNGSLEIVLVDNGSHLQVGDEMTLIAASTTPNDIPTEFYNDASFVGLPNGMLLDLNVDSGSLVLSVITVPEPAATAAIAGLAALLALARRRRRTQ